MPTFQSLAFANMNRKLKRRQSGPAQPSTSCISRGQLKLPRRFRYTIKYYTQVVATNSTAQVLSSFIMSLGLVFSSTPTILKLVVNAANIAICVLARTHISNFWSGKAKVPFVKGFNAAITSTNIIKDHLGLLAVSWIMTTAVEAWRLGRS
jgi:hypothetical protein